MAKTLIGNIKGPKGDTGNTGATGATGATGPAGPGVPNGGDAGDMLVKNSGTNQDTKWIAPGTLTEIVNLQNELGIVVDGKRSAVNASIGQYVILKNSTITDRTDGLYTAAKAISANNDIDKTYLTAVSKGGLNSMLSAFSNLFYYKRYRLENQTIASAGGTKSYSLSDLGATVPAGYTHIGYTSLTLGGTDGDYIAIISKNSIGANTLLRLHNTKSGSATFNIVADLLFVRTDAINPDSTTVVS